MSDQTDKKVFFEILKGSYTHYPSITDNSALVSCLRALGWNIPTATDFAWGDRRIIKDSTDRSIALVIDGHCITGTPKQIEEWTADIILCLRFMDDISNLDTQHQAIDRFYEILSVK